ncbi:MAG: glyoxylate/hydroxypyruvate reductase A [Pseudomonadota bacterium]
MTSPDLLLAGQVSQAERAAFMERFGERITDEPQDSIRYAACWGPEPGLLAKLPGLEVIFSLGAGVDHLLRDPNLPDVPIVRFVDPDLTGRMVEYVVLQCLMHLRRQRDYDESQQGKRWEQRAMPTASEVTVGILGFGTLGQACGKALQAVGFAVRGLNRSKRDVAGFETFGSEGMADFLGGTDILVNLMPATPHTEGLLNGDLIDGLRGDSPLGAPVLINAGRGASQNEDDIAHALKTGRLSGATLDVFRTEPLPETSPLWDAPGAVITPHVAAVTSPEAMARYVAGQLERLKAGLILENVVDRTVGY